MSENKPNNRATVLKLAAFNKIPKFIFLKSHVAF